MRRIGNYNMTEFLADYFKLKFELELISPATPVIFHTHNFLYA